MRLQITYSRGVLPQKLNSLPTPKCLTERPNLSPGAPPFHLFSFMCISNTCLCSTNWNLRKKMGGMHGSLWAFFSGPMLSLSELALGRLSNYKNWSSSMISPPSWSICRLEATVACREQPLWGWTKMEQSSERKASFSIASATFKPHLQ